MKLHLSLLLALALPLAACGDDGAAPAGDTTAAGDTVAADATSADATDASDVYIPPLEKVSKITFKLNGVNNVFDVNGQADHIASGDPGNLMKIFATKATRKLELNLLPVDEYVVGHWSDSEFSEVTVLICYNDGTAPQELPTCQVGFTHEAIAYDVTIAENNGVGSYVTGSFTATLQDVLGGTLEVTDGVFDVKHR